MKRKNTSRPLPSRFRGLYHRIATKLGVDASYVSRVARGERRSREISTVLETEVRRLLNTRRLPNPNPAHSIALRRQLEAELIKSSGALLKTQLHTARLWLQSAVLPGNGFGGSRYLDKALRAFHSVRRLHRLLRLSDADYREIQDQLDQFAAAVRLLRTSLKHSQGHTRLEHGPANQRV